MLELKHIHKDYIVDKKAFTAIKDLNLVFPDKGFVAILGPSGCGKTTLLNIIGGLDHYTSGDLLIDGRSTKEFKDSDWDAYRNKRIGFVFQSYNLINHYTVLQNVEISMLLNGTDKKTRTEKAKKVLDRVGLLDTINKKPNQLSGGQMQRVAIARALINDPEIILADEPTGALDSKTSVQVLDLIKEVGKDRCVIMVTHNRELALKYADRIIEMKDGEILKDSAPIASENKEPVGKETNKRTGMSMLTAIKSSGQSILTKKGRTVLTAVACSIGLIGVALVLATRNGFSLYVDNVESSVASSVPISITPTIYTYKTVDTNDDVVRPDDENIYIDDTTTTTYISHHNNLNQTYFDYIEKCLPNSGDKNYQGLATDIVYNRENLDFHFLTQDGSRVGESNNPVITHIDQYDSAGSVSSVIGQFTSLPTTIMHELFADDKYDVIYGHYPTKSNEMVLIVDQYNKVSYSVLQDLGIVSSNKSASKGEKISFSSIVKDGDTDTTYKEYKAYRNSDYYRVDQADSKKTWTFNSWELSDYVDGTSADDTFTLNLSPLEYKYKKTKSTKDINFYLSPDNYECYTNDDIYNPIDCEIVGVLRPSTESYLSLMPSSLGYLSSLKDTMAADTQTPIAQGGSKEMATYQLDNHYIYRDDDTTSSKDGLNILKNSIETLFDTYSSSDSYDTSALSTSLSKMLDGVYRFMPAYNSKQGYTEGWIGYQTRFSGYIKYLEATGADYDASETADMPALDDLDGWISLAFSADFLGGGCMPYLAYVNSYSSITSVLIFPASLTTKERLRSYLNAFNDQKADVDQIQYSDLMNDFTSSLGILIDVISAVLIVFASISLVVSSVMTAIITYVSVIERTKEIGILRACGAKKNDVGRLFEAECIITGFVAGVIGIGITYLLCIPINLILDNKFPGNGLGSIANLNPWHALILLALSILLAFLSGFIPSRIAARKDPVICLRSE